MKNDVQVILTVLVAFAAIGIASCDKQSTKSEIVTSSKKTHPSKTTPPSGFKQKDGRAKWLDIRVAWKEVVSAEIIWTDAKLEAAKRGLSQLVELHKVVSETPTYENALVSADCELKLCNNIVPALIHGYLSPDEAHSMLAVIAANRFSKPSLSTMLGKYAHNSKQARILIADLQSGKPVNLVEASDALLQEQGTSFFDVPTSDRLGELLDKPNPARAFQYHLIGAAKLDVASVIAEYAYMGGDLKAEDATLASNLRMKVPHLINAPGKLTNRPIGVRLIVDFLRDWRNGSFPR